MYVIKSFLKLCFNINRINKKKILLNLVCYNRDMLCEIICYENEVD